MSMSSNRCLKSIVDECWSRAGDADLSMNEWAIAAGLHVHTIERLAYGRTKYPRFQTVAAMASAVGLSLTLTQVRTLKRKAG